MLVARTARRAAFVASLLLGSLLAGVAPAATTAPLVGRLGVNEHAFWAGTVAAPEQSPGGQLYRYRLEVEPGGRQLRVAADHPDYRQSFQLDVVDPDGKRTSDVVSWNTLELVFRAPKAGTWQVEARTYNGLTDFRLRARLDGPARKAPAKPVALLPNLRLVPPYEFTFSSQVTVVREGQGSIGPLSCNAHDMAENRAVRCLRFSLGPANDGAGPMALRFEKMQGVATPGQVTQRIQWSDGSWTERPAGEFIYHATHMHYHHSGFGSLELLKVTDPAKGTMVPAGLGPKQGFCTGDVMLFRWTHFGNAPQHSAPSSCLTDMGPAGAFDPSRGTTMGLSAGWADLYSWEQDGNYVEFGQNGDGLYVVRSTADAANAVLESNERDNTGYAYIRISGDKITVLERGRGTGPWDRKKQVVRDGLNLVAS